MLVPLSWLNDYVELDVDPYDREAVRELGQVFDSLGLVVEGTDVIGEGLVDVILARVIEIRPIEGADKIRLAVVDAGGDAPLEVVCGAWNYGIGDVVPLAQVGVTLPNGMEIARRKMRGVVSNGMLCSPSELNIANDHEGLMVVAKTGSAHGDLPAGLELGMPITEYLNIIPDVVFDLSIEPNRPDALSMLGIARDLAAKLKKKLVLPEIRVSENGPDVSTLASVSVRATDLSERLIARVITDVRNIDSPPEIARRLTLSGMRPINAIVDASNYVMLELGQPTHPYDLAKLTGRGIGVRRAFIDERLVTLDGIERILGKDGGEDLVITDGNDNVVGLAGIMGGASSEISPSTTEVLLEVASFSSLAVGRTSAEQNLRSEASIRFWRGTDPAGLERAADRYCQLVIAAHEAKGLEAPLVAKGRLESAPPVVSERQVLLRTSRVNELLGTALSTAEIASYLAPLGFPSTPVASGLEVTIPSFRPDSSREVDLIEEVARHYGYEQIVGTSRRSPNVGRLTGLQQLRRDLRRVLAGEGAHEAWTSSIVDAERERSVGGTVQPVELANPIVVGESALRTHLLSGLCGALRHNESHRNGEIRLFEIGNVFSAPSPGDDRPGERELAAALFAGRGDDAGVAMGAWRSIVEGLGLAHEQFDFEQSAPGELLEVDWLGVGAHPTRSARIVVGGETVAVVGEIDPRVQELIELAPRRVGWLVIDVAVLSNSAHVDAQAKPVSRFPSADVDLSFVLDDTMPAHRLQEEITTAAGELGESVRLVDVYRGRGVEEGSRSLTYRVRFSALDRTLGDSEIADARRAIISAVEANLPATLRS